MNLHDQAIQEAITVHGETTIISTSALLHLAAQLKIAGILHADLYGALPAAVRVNLPEDIADRLTSPAYESALESFLPAHLTDAMLDLVIIDAHDRTERQGRHA